MKIIELLSIMNTLSSDQRTVTIFQDRQSINGNVNETSNELQ